MAIAILVLSVLLGSFAQLALKKGMLLVGVVSLSNLVREPQRLLNIPWLYLGGALYASSLLLWLVVLSKLELSRAYPMVSLGYLVTFALGALLLKESVSLPKLLGLVLIMGGVALLARG